MSLYRKYRPKDFDDVLGNEAEVESFSKTIEKKEPPHSFLLIGPSGCGKTTLARIAADKLGADSLSISELNTADNRGIDTARQIIEQMQYAPMGGGVRVFIIDEVHQTSKDWQNAMLKPLEDTPEHIYFFLCTTDPKKLIKAIQTRCTKVEVKAQEPDTLYRLLRRVSKKEELEISKEILQEISENSDGSPRQALVLLEQVSGMEDEKDMRRVIEMGPDEKAETIELCRVLLNAKKFNEVSPILRELTEPEPEQIRYAVLGYMNSVLVKSGNHRAAVVIECFQDPFYNSGKAGLSLACYQVFAD